MDITPDTEKVGWSPEASEKMHKDYGRGPFKVLKVLTSRDNCAPGTHAHVRVQLAGRKPGTFCGKFFQSV